MKVIQINRLAPPNLKPLVATCSLIALVISGIPISVAMAFGGSGSGTSNDPYLISSCANFEQIASSLAANYKLTQSLDCATAGNTLIIEGGEFTGVLDGNGHSINMALVSNSSNIGLFDSAANGTIKNLNLTGSVDAGNSGSANEVGSLAGFMNGETVTNVTSSVNVSGNGDTSMGGLVGYLLSSSITNATYSGTLTASGLIVGGLFGYAICGSTITNSHFTGTITTTGNGQVGGFTGQDGCEGPGSTYTDDSSTGNITSSGAFIGGIVGNAYGVTINHSYATGNIQGTDGVGGLMGHADYTSSISQSYALGTVTGTTNVGGLIGDQAGSTTISQSFATGSSTASTGFAGGLVGQLESGSSVTDSYARGNVNGVANGGLVGYYNSGSITNSYATGTVSGTGAEHGGLVGIADDSTVSSSFWDTQTSGHTNSLFGFGKTTAAMQSVATYTSLATSGLAAPWDFVSNPNNDTGNANIWNIFTGTNSGYPCLVWYGGCAAPVAPTPSPSPTPSATPTPSPTVTPPGIVIPNNGDANDDAIIDTTQPYVGGTMSTDSGRYVAVQVPGSCSLQSVSDHQESANAVLDSGYAYPAGFLNYIASCGTVGYTATIKVYVYGVTDTGLILRKYNPITRGYSTVSDATIRPVIIGGQQAMLVTYSVKDGGPLDTDGTTNGTIIDPVGLAKLNVAVPNTGIL